METGDRTRSMPRPRRTTLIIAEKSIEASRKSGIAVFSSLGAFHVILIFQHSYSRPAYRQVSQVSPRGRRTELQRFPSELVE